MRSIVPLKKSSADNFCKFVKVFRGAGVKPDGDPFSQASFFGARLKEFAFLIELERLERPRRRNAAQNARAAFVQKHV